MLWPGMGVIRVIVEPPRNVIKVLGPLGHELSKILENKGQLRGFFNPPNPKY